MGKPRGQWTAEDHYLDARNTLVTIVGIADGPNPAIAESVRDALKSLEAMNRLLVGERTPDTSRLEALLNAAKRTGIEGLVDGVRVSLDNRETVDKWMSQGCACNIVPRPQ